MASPAARILAASSSLSSSSRLLLTKNSNRALTGGGSVIATGLASRYNDSRIFTSAQQPIEPLIAAQQHQHHYCLSYCQQQQFRSYWFIPTSLLEAQERFERWTETTKHTTIKVKLIDLRQRTSDNLDKFRKRRTGLINRFQTTRTVMVNKGKARSQRMITKLKLQRLAGQERYQTFKLRRKLQYLAFKHKYRKAEFQERFLQRPWILRKKQQYQTFKHNRKQDWIRTKQVLVDEYTKPEWFDNDFGRPKVSKDITGRFLNPWKSQSTNGVHGLGTILRWRLDRMIRQANQFLSWATSSASSSSSSSSSITPLSLLSPPPPLPSSPSSVVVSGFANDDNDNDDFEYQTRNNKHSKIQFTWIGHSTCYIQMNGLKILTDPMFSKRAGPYQSFPIGPTRELPPSHTIQQIAEHCNDSIDLCCITHDHYDHMDVDSCIELAKYVQLWIVPLGIKKWLMDNVPGAKIDPPNIIELEWWQQIHIEKILEEGERSGTTVVAHHHAEREQPEKGKTVTSDTTTPLSLLSTTSTVATSPAPSVSTITNGLSSGNNKNRSNSSSFTTITCCPSSHWCGRNLFDRNFRLWCSFAFNTTSIVPRRNNESDNNHNKGLRFFFCGDTGYPEDFPLFRQIGDALGPFDLSAIPIGAYKPTEMMKDAHVDPYEAFKIHKDLRSRRSIGIHWGTFPLSEENFDDPPKELHRAITADVAAPAAGENEEEEDSVANPFTTLEHGQSIEVCSMSPTMTTSERSKNASNGKEEENEFKKEVVVASAAM